MARACAVRRPEPIQPLLRVVSAAGVREFLSAKPSLEDLFLSHYGADDASNGKGNVSQSELLEKSCSLQSTSVPVRRATMLLIT